MTTVPNNHEQSGRLLALHGFTLGGAMFDELEPLLPGSLVAPDLPGHGGRGAGNTSWRSAVDEVIALATQVAPRAVLGYSMGGRLALAAALEAPEMFPRLILVSTSLGIADPEQRATRLADDETDAAAIESLGDHRPYVTDFGRQPFLQAPASPIDLMAIRMDNSTEGIAAALRGMGQGAQPYLGDRLGQLEIPTVWVAGSRDPKYKGIAMRAAQMCQEGTVVILDAAHNVIAEQPAAVAAIVAEVV